ncbi:MAG: ATP-binding protein [Verrucomicrobiota bacterium]
MGRVNLITGRNNTGKSSILEALRILASGAASPSVLSSILRYREEDVSEADAAGIPVDPESSNQFSSLFTGFPKLSENREAIVLLANGGERSMRLNISVGLFSEEEAPDGTTRLLPQKPQTTSSAMLPETELIPALVMEDLGSKRILPMDHPVFSRRRPFRSAISDEPRLPCVFVSPYGGERTAPLGLLWDKIALSDLEKDVVEALKILAPEIMAVSMVGGEGPQQMRTAIVRSSEFSRPVPLRSFGDGLNRLFGIILSLVNAKGGFLLIDEFENGMHHTIEFGAWETIFRLSKFLNVQVFATSHSWDAVETFQKAAALNPEEGVLIRLSRKGDAIIPTLFQDKELAVATREHIEVR